ncbi:MAG: right-handed parallel beta-helix repeat-containing protein [Acidobacteria bacterium]|nr:right-handed parallel beta-helix repeat-containing protein [Acidobacteriota bacterium]MCB9397996.1 right-handed parallel beta-helix repeat-containing protein [Acidobacteriota bacterium]
MFPKLNLLMLNLLTTAVLAQIPSSERAALIEIATQLGSDLYFSGSWRDADGAFLPPGSEGNWYGVTLSGNGEHVIGLRLNGQSFENLPASIVQLSQLESLYLYGNKHQGTTPVPEFMAELVQLRKLSLLYSGFAGPIPSSWSQLTQLQDLFLQLPGLGRLPGFLGDLNQLETLAVIESDLTSIDSHFFAAPNIQNLDLSHNKLEESALAGARAWPQLTHLNLGNNLFVTIPDWVVLNTNLVELFFWSNRLQGQWPEGLSGLTQLETLILTSNFLTGPLPTLADFPNLNDLDLSFNQFQGSLSDLGPNQLSYLNLESNALNTQLPENWANWSHLTSLNIADCGLQGPLPQGLAQLAHLDRLDLHNNQLSGTLPKQWASQMYAMDLSNNGFVGEIPGQLPVSGYASMNLGYNHFTSLAVNGTWPYEMFLEYNDLDESSCDVFTELRNQGKYVQYYRQNNSTLACGLEPVLFFPWVANNGQQWDSLIAIENPGDQIIDVALEPSAADLEPIFINLYPHQTQTVSFPNREGGFAVRLNASAPDITASLTTFNRLAASGNSPAKANAIRFGAFASDLLYTYVPGADQAAIVIAAPQQSGNTQITLSLLGEAGRLGQQAITVQAGQPRAFLLHDLFPGAPEHAAILAHAESNIPLAGMAFGFNAVNEPAMTQAIDAKRHAAELWAPWLVNNTQFQGRLVLTNPHDQNITVMLTAYPRSGSQQKMQVTLAAQSIWTQPTQALFDGLDGYALQIQSFANPEGEPLGVEAAFFVLLQTPDRAFPSPALTQAVSLAEATDGCSFSGLPDRISALVLVAPHNIGSLPVQLSLFSTYGQRDMQTITLTDAQPKAVLLDELFGPDDLEELNAITARSPRNSILGTTFSFNENREPAMSEAVPVPAADLQIQSFQVRCENDHNAVRFSVQNGGHFPAARPCQVNVSMGDQLVETVWLSALAPDEIQSFSLDLPPNSQATYSLHLDPSNAIPEQIETNNQMTLSAAEPLVQISYDQMSQTEIGDWVHLIFADQMSGQIPLTGLRLTTAQNLIIRAERLKFTISGSATDRAGISPKFVWLSDPSVRLDFDRNTGIIAVNGGQTGGIYRITGNIQGGGSTAWSGVIAHFSRSAYPQSAFREDAEPRVIHPFYPQGFRLGTPAAGSWDLESDSGFFEDLNNYYLLEQPASAQVLELPVGVMRSTITLSNLSCPVSVIGQGSNQSLVLGSYAFKPGSPDNSTTNLLLWGRGPGQLRDFAIWGGDPSEANLPEVSGQAQPFMVGTRTYYRYVYQNVPNGILSLYGGSLHIENMDFRYLNACISMFKGRPQTGWTLDVANSAFFYANQGISCEDLDGIRVRNCHLFHFSTQGIVASNGKRVWIESNQIDGARARGINLDRFSEVLVRDNDVRNSGQTGIHFGGAMREAVVENNRVFTVDRDRENPFADDNRGPDGILPYRPVYEGIKVVRGQWGDSADILIQNNQISDCGDGIFLGQGNIKRAVVSGNQIEARRRGIRLEFGWANTMIEHGESFWGQLEDIWVTADNQLEVIPDEVPIASERHRVLFPCSDQANSIILRPEFAADLGHQIAYYPLPIDFFNTNACPNRTCQDACRVWVSNAASENPSSVYLPQLGPADYLGHGAHFQPMESAPPGQLENLIQAIHTTVFDSLGI